VSIDRANVTYAPLPRASDAVLLAFAKSRAALDERFSAFGVSCVAKLDEQQTASLAKGARRVAIHEGGHAVADVTLFGCGAVVLVTLHYEEYRGTALASPRRKRADRRAVCTGFYAGVVAECCAPFAILEDWKAQILESLGPEGSPFVQEASEGDRKLLARLVGTEHWFQPFWDDALRLLSTRWHAVHAVASALLAHGTLQGEEVDRIVTQANE